MKGYWASFRNISVLLPLLLALVGACGAARAPEASYPTPPAAVMDPSQAPTQASHVMVMSADSDFEESEESALAEDSTIVSQSAALQEGASDGTPGSMGSFASTVVAAPPPPPQTVPGVQAEAPMVAEPWEQPRTEPIANDTGASTPDKGASVVAVSGAVVPARHPLLIYRAELALAVFETKKTLDSIEEGAKRLGGYLVQRDANSIVVRVPVASFEKAVAEAALAGDELSRNVTAEDVTADYNDVKIRLRNAEAVRDRLQSLLARATNVEEAIAVERELGRVTAEIEQMKGKLKLFNELLAYSTVTVRLHPKASAEQLKQSVALPFPFLRRLGLSSLLYLESDE